MREFAHFSIDSRRFGKIQMGKGIGIAGTLLDAEKIQECPPCFVGWTAMRTANTDIGRRLPAINRQQLGMAIGDMQQSDITEIRRGVKRVKN